MVSTTGFFVSLTNPSHDSSAVLAVGSSFILAVLGLLLASTAKQYYRLRHFDGPFLACISQWWLFKTVTGDRAYLEFWEVNKRYGKLARIGPNDLITGDPAFVKHMTGSKSGYRRSAWYDAMRSHPARNNLFSLTDDSKHSKLRNKMLPAYSGREVPNLESKVDQNILELTRLIEKYASLDQPLDFGLIAQYFTLDTISDIAFDKPFGFLETDSDVYNYIKTTEMALSIAMCITVFPWIVNILASPLLAKLLPSEKDNLGFGRVMAIGKKVTAERFGPDKKVQNDMLGSFVARGLNQEEVESEIVLQIIAGSDTTATAIRTTMLFLITNPPALERLRLDIAAVNTGEVLISEATTRRMPYLEAVIKEGLRMYPPAAGLLSKEAPPEGDTWKGMFIPGGTRIGYGAWSIFRDEEIFGEDSSEFRPERWLDESSGKVREMSSVLELIFSYGRYQCLGKSIAMMELRKTFVHLVTTFDFTVCNPEKPWVVTNPGFFNISKFYIRARKRSSGNM